MRSKIGPAKLNPDVLFAVTADAPPAHVKTIDEVLLWQAGEHEKMLEECGRLLREQLIEVFAEFQRDQEGLPN